MIMKAKIKHIWTSLIGSILSLLGFSSCDTWQAIFPADEYGCPSASYKVTIEVTDEDGAPIKGIKVESSAMTSGTTGSDGVFYEELGFVFPRSPEYILTDVDGPENGGCFQSDTLKFEDFDSDQIGQGDGHWFSGTYALSATAKLKKTADNE